jgi:hypothetical protein
MIVDFPKFVRFQILQFASFYKLVGSNFNKIHLFFVQQCKYDKVVPFSSRKK